MVFLYNNNKLSEIESKKTISFTVQQQQNKVPRNRFNQGGKHLYLENYKTLKKESEESTNK